MTVQDEFPIPFRLFARELAGTPDEIWTRLLAVEHGRENHLLGEWYTLLDDKRSRPA